MAIRKTLGGDRLGSGNKMNVEMHGWGKSTHDLSEKLKTTMAPGTLVPFLNKVVLPGDEWKIRLDADVMTAPTNGPLFGSFKFQLDTFFCPYRLYIAQLHNNKMKIALDMSKVKLPQLRMYINPRTTNDKNINNKQINPSCVLSYLGLRGLGQSAGLYQSYRETNAIPLLSYWDIYKNYYANKQEKYGQVIHTKANTLEKNVESAKFQINKPDDFQEFDIPKGNENPNTFKKQILAITTQVAFELKAGTKQNAKTLVLITEKNGKIERKPLTTFTQKEISEGTGFTGIRWDAITEIEYIVGWDYAKEEERGDWEPEIAKFELEKLDEIRELILKYDKEAPVFGGNNTGLKIEPLSLVMESEDLDGSLKNSMEYNQEGLALKTYQADINNAWLRTDYVDLINQSTNIVIENGQFSIDQLQLAKKKWEHLNRLVASGGTYKDWLEVAYGVREQRDFEIPMYLGGLSKEIVFQEVVSSVDSGDRALGSLGGRGVLSGKHKGGYVELKAKEAGVLMGIMSITPRVDYSQGNDWAINLKTMDDLHKPAFDGIGFQDLITDTLTWWDTKIDAQGNVRLKSAGKIPAWLNYQTSVNKTLGNFADESEMWMTLNRNYEITDDFEGIKDLTTYVDPKKYNYIWANARRDAQNFWVQVDSNITVRRVMSAKQIPTF